jgi:hypothetical protein
MRKALIVIILYEIVHWEEHMSSTTTSKRAALGSIGSSQQILAGVVWAEALSVGAYFVLTYVPAYFVWSEESYGPYFWPRAGLLLPHVVAGLIAIVLGSFQFWPRIRTSYPKVHRISGRIYLGSVLIAASAGIVLAATSALGLAYGVGLFALSVAWLVTSGMAFLSIRRRNFVQHTQWMVRSYVVTSAFVIFRLGDNVMEYLGVGMSDRFAIMAWACWALPLLITEVVIQGRQVFGGRTSSVSSFAGNRPV